MLSAVLDTNIVVSAHLRADGRQSQLLRLAWSGAFQLVVSAALLEEYEEVLCRPRFKLTPGLVEQSLREVRRVARMVQPRFHFHLASDPDDNHVIDCAVAAKADYIVTGNVADFPSEVEGVLVVSPLEFQTILAATLP